MTVSMADEALQIRSMNSTSRDLELFAACFEKNGSPRSLDALRWQYSANPTGRTYVDFAVADGERLAAIYASLPVYVRVNGTVRLALQSLDTMTDGDFRGRGLFVKLAKRTFARAEADGAAFIYGFPNGNSAHGFFERLGWTKIDPLPFLIRPLRSEYVLRRLGFARTASVLPNLSLRFGRPAFPRGTRLETIERFDARHDRVWQSVASRVGVAVERDARYLNWRLVDKPHRNYVNCAVTRNEQVVAWASHCVLAKHEGRVGYVMEALCASGDERALRGLLSSALADMQQHNADVALAWCLPQSPTYKSFLAMGFVPFPDRYRPIELHGGVRSFDARLADVLSDRRAWYLSYLDSDTV
jgi:GNAT superfamily N-acetyltransferase